MPMAAGAMSLCKYPASELTESQTNTPNPQQKLFIYSLVILSVHYCPVNPYQMVKSAWLEGKGSWWSTAGLVARTWCLLCFISVAINSHPRTPQKAFDVVPPGLCSEYNFMEHNFDINMLKCSNQTKKRHKLRNLINNEDPPNSGFPSISKADAFDDYIKSIFLQWNNELYQNNFRASKEF